MPPLFWQRRGEPRFSTSSKKKRKHFCFLSSLFFAPRSGREIRTRHLSGLIIASNILKNFPADSVSFCEKSRACRGGGWIRGRERLCIFKPLPLVKEKEATPAGDRETPSSHRGEIQRLQHRR
ncbi:Putative hypothetical protein [Helicobacter mustelae 12198]|uniref:Uncharacterized protein n=1 Tax=Helicobacter mustelae (strain ATCC 43772 / CCUG 25715 / CIP 103759 / LMG 18044 / NCTC 12198 / R85-136P) TaxID=679897 RepID=D3UHL4_HELM1|nr:Putative hypothetical protein [Helicobacter mustelae 12198]